MKLIIISLLFVMFCFGSFASAQSNQATTYLDSGRSYVTDIPQSTGCWVLRQISTSTGRVEGQLYIYQPSDKTAKNYYALDLDKFGKVSGVRITTSTTPGVVDGLWVNMKGQPSIIESDVNSKPLVYLYDDLLRSMTGLPETIQTFLSKSRDAVFKAAEKPATLTLVKTE